MMLERDKQVVGEIAGPPRVLAEQGFIEVGDYAVVFPLKVENPASGRSEDWDVVIDVGEDPTEPGPLAARGRAVMDQLGVGDQVRVRGDWHMTATDGREAGRPLLVHRVYAVEVHDADGQPLQVDPDATMEPVDPREPFLVENWEAPLYPRGLVELDPPDWDYEDGPVPEGMGTVQMMPLCSAAEIRNAIWTTPTPRRPHAPAERGVAPRDQSVPQAGVRVPTSTQAMDLSDEAVARDLGLVQQDGEWVVETPFTEEERSRFKTRVTDEEFAQDMGICDEVSDVEPRERPAPQAGVRATDAELEQAGVDREELTRGARRLSLELGAKFLPREADRRSAAEALESMEPRHGARPARATWTPENPRATTAQRRVPKAAGSEIDRAAEGMARGQVPSPGASGPEVSGPSR
ncbi:hypothetical protein [Micrococcus endophyticus]|uniref:hypothetical protein n=1 Tax=Micrococcus endophyticus TaxID=455343 RepID=UPI0034CF9DB4